MYNKKLKKLLATLLATLMVIGCCGTAFAAGSANSGGSTGSGGATASGEPEGHLDKHVTKMVFPTITADTFKYIVDPETLIQETSGAKYTNATFPAAASDTHVYFETGTNAEGGKIYANTTKTLYAVNKGTEPITLTIKVKTVATSNKDITLATGNAAADLVDDTATPKVSKLYLAFTIGKSATATVLSGSEETVTKTISGATNYETTYNATSGKYEYTEKAKADDKLGNEWKAIPISLSGAVGGNPIADDTTSPKVSMTWSWAPAAAGATASTDLETVTAYTDDDGVTTYLNATDAAAKLAEVQAANQGGNNGQQQQAATPSISPTSNISASSLVYTVSNGTVASISITRTNTVTATFTEGTQYTLSNNDTTITFASTMPSGVVNKGGTVTITLTDGSTLTLMVAS